MTEPGVEDGLRIELDRLATRLRILGSRWSSDDSPRSPGDEHPEAVVMVRSVLQRLADLAADVEGMPCRRLPELDPYALADQLLVLTQDLLSAADPGTLDRARRLLADLRQDL